MTLKIKQTLTYVLAATFLFSGIFSSSLQAKMFSTEQVQQQYDKAQLLDVLDSTEVQKKLLALGVDADQVKERVNNLSAAEVEQLNANLADMPAGADGLGLIVFIFVVFVITDMIGATDVFPFVNEVN